MTTRPMLDDNQRIGITRNPTIVLCATKGASLGLVARSARSLERPSTNTRWKAGIASHALAVARTHARGTSVERDYSTRLISSHLGCAAAPTWCPKGPRNRA